MPHPFSQRQAASTSWPALRRRTAGRRFCAPMESDETGIRPARLTLSGKTQNLMSCFGLIWCRIQNLSMRKEYSVAGKRSVDLTGQRFGHLTAIRISPEHSKRGHPKWICVCDCGTTKLINQLSLRNGRSRSCGHVNATQGGLATKHPMWWRWSHMIARCKNPKDKRYPAYGGRGIDVCERWLHFPSFLADMEGSFFAGASLDRIDNDGDYAPQNVRWATPRQQNANQRRTVFIETPSWGRIPRAEAARKMGVPVMKFIHRHRIGWSVERLFDPSNWIERR